MTTKWYFRSSAASVGPTGEVSTDTDSFPTVPTNKNTPLDMTREIGAAQVGVAGLYNTASSPLYAMIRMFVSPELAAQTLTAGATYTIGFGRAESSAQMNMFLRFFIYVWRSGSGNVKTVVAAQSDPTEEGAAESGVFTRTGLGRL